MLCVYCNRHIDIEEGDYSPDAYKKVVLHVWQYHDETDQGISLRDTLENGPSQEEE